MQDLDATREGWGNNLAFKPTEIVRFLQCQHFLVSFLMQLLLLDPSVPPERGFSPPERKAVPFSLHCGLKGLNSRLRSEEGLSQQEIQHIYPPEQLIQR